MQPARRFSILLLLALAVLAAAALDLFWLHGLKSTSAAVSDHFLRLHAAGKQGDPGIVIIDIDEKSLAAMADRVGSYPWPRAVHGELLEGLAAGKPAAVVFDLLFTDPDLYRRESDAYFNEVMGRMDNVYLPMLRLPPEGDAQGISLDEYGIALGLTKTPLAKPGARVSLALPGAVEPRNWRLGTINYLEDDDGVGRRYFLYLNADGWRLPSLPARVAQGLGYAIPPGESLLLDWEGVPFGHRHYSYVDVYDAFSGSKGSLKPEDFAGKIVLIGASAAGLHDLRTTPISSRYPAVEILATALDNLKSGHSLRQAGGGWVLVLCMLLIAGLFLLFRRHLGPARVGVALAAASAALLGVEYAAVAIGRLVLPVFLPLAAAWTYYLAATVHVYLDERRARLSAIETFGRFLDPRVVRGLVDRGEADEAFTGKGCELTVLFSDIRGFTTLSETRQPQEIVDLLNAYFSRQVEVIFRHGGTLDKFIGDAIMAFWGAPQDDAAQADHAVACALEMVDNMLAFRRELGELGEIFDVGIGIHTGPAVVAFIGSKQRQDYTAIGDSVNLASRIEGQTKGVARVLVSADTKERCRRELDFIDHGAFKVKGRTAEVRLWEPRRRTE